MKKKNKEKSKDKNKEKRKDKRKDKELELHEASDEIDEKSPVTLADSDGEVKRLNRIIGQIEGIKKMLESERALDDILIQCKAVHSALKSIESRLLKTYLDVAVNDIMKAEKKKSREQKVSELMDLYRPV